MASKVDQSFVFEVVGAGDAAGISERQVIRDIQLLDGSKVGFEPVLSMIEDEHMAIAVSRQQRQASAHYVSMLRRLTRVEDFRATAALVRSR